MKGKAMFCTLFLICMLAASTTMVTAATPPALGRIEVEKYVSMGPSVTTDGWLRANDLPGPYGLAGGEILFKYRVQNTGGMPILGVQLIDSAPIDLSRCVVVEPLMPGAAAECVVGPFPIGAGQNLTTVIAIGRVSSGWVQDRDDANYFGAVVALKLETYVRANAQSAWIPADDPPGLYVAAGSAVYFRYEGTNTGNVPLTSISLGNTLVGIDQARCTMVEPLMPGASFSCTAGPLTAAAGQQKASATARGQFLNWAAEDSDNANFFGVLAQVDIEDAIGVEWPDTNGGSEGIKWFDADEAPGVLLVVNAKFYRKWSGTNTGNVPLESVQVLADVLDGAPSRCIIFEPVMPGDSFECLTGPFRAAPGVQSNKTTVRGTFASWTAEDSDTTYYQGVYVTTDPADQAKARPAR